jgi:hypothetical protein
MGRILTCILLVLSASSGALAQVAPPAHEIQLQVRSSELLNIFNTGGTRGLIPFAAADPRAGQTRAARFSTLQLLPPLTFSIFFMAASIAFFMLRVSAPWLGGKS